MKKNDDIVLKANKTSEYVKLVAIWVSLGKILSVLDLHLSTRCQYISQIGEIVYKTKNIFIELLQVNLTYNTEFNMWIGKRWRKCLKVSLKKWF